jgi:hypothetical protein
MKQKNKLEKYMIWIWVLGQGVCVWDNVFRSSLIDLEGTKNYENLIVKWQIFLSSLICLKKSQCTLIPIFQPYFNYLHNIVLILKKILRYINYYW